MVEGNRKKRILAGFFVFLGAMWLCTVISKSVYAAKLPIVSTDSAEQKYVEHIVKVDGIVIAGQKNPVSTLGGLRVDQLLVQTGDRVEEGDVLFTIDMEDLSQVIEEKQAAVSKLQAQINVIVENKELARQQKEREEQRAREDYDALARHEDTLVGRAAEQYSRIEDEIDEQMNGEKRRIEAERERARAEGNEWDYDAGDVQGGEVDEVLLEALQQAAYAEADAQWQRENAMKEAGRTIEDILTPDNRDSALEVSRLELSGMQEELARYQAIQSAEGQVRAPWGGLITDIYVATGARTPDSAAVLLADDSVPCQFKTTVTQEQKKYVGLNDTVSLKLDGGSREKEATVDYLSESVAMPGHYEIYINLPEGTGVPGLSGVMTRAESGEKFSCCVKPEAVHTEGARSYVYVVKEREGILGKEYYAEQVNVIIQDENDNWVAVEGALDQDSVIITSATKEVKNGDVVRLSEE